MIAGSCALLAGLTIWIFLRHLENAYSTTEDLAPVLVAKRFIPRGTPLRALYFRSAQFPKNAIEPDAVPNFDLLESSGRPRFRTPLSIPQNAQLVQRELQSLTQGESLTQLLEENQTAVSFSIDATRGLGG